MAVADGVKIRRGSINDLITLYKQSYEKLSREMLTATEAGKIRKARTMARINSELTRLGVDVKAWVKAEIPQYYLDGANTAMQGLRAAGIQIEKPAAVIAIDREAVSALTSETATAFADSIQTVSRSGRNILNNAQKQQLNFQIAQGKLTGDALRTVAQNVERQLSDGGLYALVDKANKRWSLDTYAETLARTKAVEARNQGLTNRMLSLGYDLVQVSDHNSRHLACHVWEGKILSLTGMTPTGTDLPGGFTVEGSLEEAKTEGLFHPNCEHAVNTLLPELASKTNAYDNPFNYLDLPRY